MGDVARPTIPAALRRRESVRRGLSIRLRAEARVLRGLCVEAEAAGYGGRDLELVQRYCEVLEGWCLGERSSAELAGATNAASNACDRSKLHARSNVRQQLLRAACALAEDRARWCAYPTHAWPDVTCPSPASRDFWRCDALCGLRGLRLDSQGREAWEVLYRAQVDALVGLARSRFADLDAITADAVRIVVPPVGGVR